MADDDNPPTAPPAIPEGRLRIITRDGAPTWQLGCPQCGCWGDIDDDQLHGRVSVDHTDSIIPCTFHETRDWFVSAAPWGGTAIAATGRTSWNSERAASPLHGET